MRAIAMYLKYPNYIMINRAIIYLVISISSLVAEANINESKSINYIGGWPEYKNKESILKTSNTKKIDCPKGVGCDCSDNNDCINQNCQRDLKGNMYCAIKEGDLFPHFKAIDQFEEIVDIYDFANDEGKYILIEMGAAWCSPCHSLASWITWNEDEIKSKPFWREKYNKIKTLIENGDIYFITILYEDEFRDNAIYDTVYEWYNTYPDESIPILADEEKILHSIIRPTGIPAITLLSPKMEVITLSSRGFNKSFDKLLKIMEKNDNGSK